MSDFETILGFEDRLPPASPRRTSRAKASSRDLGNSNGARARLSRIANGAPEVMVKINGRIRERRLLRAHLDYVSREGALEMEDQNGAVIAGRSAVRELADDWSAIDEIDSRRRVDGSLSHAMVLSMPSDTDAAIVRDAARAFAREVFSKRFDYAFVLHTDAPHPHVHLTIRSRGEDGERLHPSNAELWTWRRTFAQALRDRGVEAEATPRWARGVTRKAERYPLRKIREQHAAGKGRPSEMLRAAYHHAAGAAFLGQTELTPWERQIVERQTKVRNLYLQQAAELVRSPDPADQALGQKLEAFVREMPAPDSQRLALARELRAAHEAERRRDRKERDREEELER